jgi:tRNA (mo5U34)-methyltransferase
MMSDALEIVQANPEWYHSIELAPGVVTPGRSPLAEWKSKLRDLQLPDLRGKSVLDIGAYDGFFSFAAEQRGASRVVALDHYAWFTDMVGYMRDWREARARGETIPAPHKTHHWKPKELPGRRPFDAARAYFQSKVEPVVGDFMNMDLETLGRFDVVLFLGVLYHLEEPLSAIRRVAQVTNDGGLCAIETEATEIPGSSGRALCEFFPGQELNDDASNWWVPNAEALCGMCRVAGFSSVRTLPVQQRASLVRRSAKALKRAIATSHLWHLPIRYRLIVHATR